MGDDAGDEPSLDERTVARLERHVLRLERELAEQKRLNLALAECLRAQSELLVARAARRPEPATESP